MDVSIIISHCGEVPTQLNLLRVKSQSLDSTSSRLYISSHQGSSVGMRNITYLGTL